MFIDNEHNKIEIMKELIESKLQGCENLQKAYWDLLKEAVERKDLSRLIDCTEELKKLYAKESGYELLLQDVIQRRK